MGLKSPAGCLGSSALAFATSPDLSPIASSIVPTMALFRAVKLL